MCYRRGWHFRSNRRFCSTPCWEMAGIPATSADAGINNPLTGGDAAWRRKQMAAGKEQQDFLLGSECLQWEGANNGALQLEAECIQHKGSALAEVTITHSPINSLLHLTFQFRLKAGALTRTLQLERGHLLLTSRSSRHVTHLYIFSVNECFASILQASGAQRPEVSTDHLKLN